MRGTLGSFARTSSGIARTPTHRWLIATVLVLLALFCLPALAGASVFTSTGELGVADFEGTGLAQAEGSGGAGKYLWVVDQGSEGQILRGYDQSTGGSPIASIEQDGAGGVGFGEISGIAFASNLNLLFVTDRQRDRLSVFPRTNSGGLDDPVDFANDFATGGFGFVGFPIDDPRGIAVDPATGIGYMSLYSADSSTRGLIAFNLAPVGTTITWRMFTYLPGAWNSGSGPGALTVDSANGNLYVAIDGQQQVLRYQSDFGGIDMSISSPSPGDFISLQVDHDSNRLFGVKSDVIEVFSIATGKYLGTADPPAHGSDNAGFAHVPGTSQYYLTSSDAASVFGLQSQDAPTCDTSEPVDAIAGETLDFAPNCTDSDDSEIEEYSVVGSPDLGTATPINDYNEIRYTAGSEAEGQDEVSFRVTTKNGISSVYTVTINVSQPDVTAPVVTIDSPTDGLVTTTDSVSLDYTVSDDRDTEPSCDVVDGSQISLEPGLNTISVTCQDDFTNSSTASVEVTYDAQAPLVEITSPWDNSAQSDSTAALEFSVSDDIDSEPVCSRSYGDEITLNAGLNTITVSCEDFAGRTGSDSVVVLYDPESPTITINSPLDGAIVTDDVPAIDYTVDDAYDDDPFCYTYIEPAVWEDPGEGGAEFYEPGLNTVSVTCRDDAYNYATAYAEVTYDAEAPQVSISSPASGVVVPLPNVIVSYSVTDDTDGEPDCNIESGGTATLVAGANTITVSCIDAAGRTGSDSVTVTYSPPATGLVEPIIRNSTNLAPTDGAVRIQLPGTDVWIPVNEAVNVPVGTIIDARNGTVSITFANADGSTYEAKFWGGVFQVFQSSGDNPIAILKLRDDLAGTPEARKAGPFSGASIARRGKKKNGLWGDGKGRYRTSGSGGSATVRGTKWYVANYDGGTLFKVSHGIVEVRPTHGDCFNLTAGQSRFIEYTPLTAKQKAKKKNKKKRVKKGCTVD